MAFKKLTIPCYFETEETLQYERMNAISAHISMYLIRDATIYDMPYAVCPHVENDVEIGSRVYVKNEYFISTLKTDEIDILIEATWGE